MPHQYRVEISPNNRANCQDGVCKKLGEKCLKGEIRFGTWTEIGDHASWRWKHWGCVSGFQIQGLRESAEDGDGYDWDRIDGYDELNDHPDVQEKVRRAVTQGHLDPEDFKGDPDWNVLGKKGIRGRNSVKVLLGEEEADGEEGSAPAKATGKQAQKKRSKAEATDDEGEKPKKRAKTSKKVKSEAKADEAEAEDEKPKPNQKKRRGKAAQQEASPDLASPAEAPKKTPGRKVSAKAATVKDEPAAEDASGPVKRGRKAKAKADPVKDDSEAEGAVVPAKRGRKAKAKAAPIRDESGTEPEAAVATKTRGRPKKAATKSAVKSRPDDDSDVEEETAPETDAEPEEKPAPKRKARGGRNSVSTAADNEVAPPAKKKRAARKSAA